MDDAWTHHGKVRARESDGVMEVVVDGLTTQAKYYKPLIYEFFHKAWRGSRPGLGSLATQDGLEWPLPWRAGGGEFAVEIRMEYVGDPPWLDLDNLAKAKEILEARGMKVNAADVASFRKMAEEKIWPAYKQQYGEMWERVAAAK